MIKYLWLSLILMSFQNGLSQAKELPFANISEYPDSYTEGAVVARMIEALGFRFYWATDNLREEDLNYKPNDASRTTFETVNHIYSLSKIIVNATLNTNNERQQEDLSFEELRYRILQNLKTASDILYQSDDISGYTIKFGNTEYPFWNQINGPISDAIWHCGQIAVNRRSSGNPINPKVNHFLGQVSN